MFTKTARLAAALSMTAAVTVTATGTAAAQNSCQDIGNGQLCMNVDPPVEGEALVTIKYIKHRGEPVTVRLSWWYYAGETFSGSWQPVAAGGEVSFQSWAVPECVYGKMEIQGGPTYYLNANPICPG